MGVNYYKGLDRVARSAGLDVETVPGADTRGHGGMGDVRSVLIHHTAGYWNKNSPADYNSRSTILNGNSGTLGPLSHYGIGRVTGTVYFFAAGLCAHAGKNSQVTAVKYRNEHAIGIEIENNGVNEPYSAKTYNAAVALAGQLVIEFNLSVNDVRGHKEIALTAAGKLGRKTDPLFSMDLFRQNVAKWIQTKHSPVVVIPAAPSNPTPNPQEDVLSGFNEDQLAAIIRNSVLTASIPTPRGNRHLGTLMTNFDADFGRLKAGQAALEDLVEQLAAAQGVVIDYDRIKRIFDASLAEASVPGKD